MRITRLVATLAFAAFAPGEVLAGATSVTVARTPDGGIQPQAVSGSDGSVHLIYFKGDPGAGDVFYVRKAAAEAEFHPPIRVNAQPGSAIALGNVRGAQLALGRNSRAHVAWMGGNGASRPKIGDVEIVPMLYSRLDDSGDGFERERNIITWAAGLDGGGTVAADSDGHVYVVWHASPKPGPISEADRAVFVARSSDDGKTFERERQANSASTGACGCCGIRAFASGGNCSILYRAANERTRDMILLSSADHGVEFRAATLSQWATRMCPMSTSSLWRGASTLVAATETRGRISVCKIDPVTLKVEGIELPDSTESQRHPVVVGNRKGETLVAWTEGVTWGKGGSFKWQLFDPDGKPSEVRGRSEGVPAWSLISACEDADDSFRIFF